MVPLFSYYGEIIGKLLTKIILFQSTSLHWSYHRVTFTMSSSCVRMVEHVSTKMGRRSAGRGTVKPRSDMVTSWHGNVLLPMDSFTEGHWINKGIYSCTRSLVHFCEISYSHFLTHVVKDAIFCNVENLRVLKFNGLYKFWNAHLGCWS